LEKGLNTEFVDYSSSLFTNSALTAIIPNQATIPPYTSAITMNHGWLWHIPLRDSTHIGYVYSDSFATEKELKKEILRKHPKAEHFRQLSFRSGRHQKALSGNVLAIGNAFGFVEPLESTGLHMIVSSLKAFAEIFKNQSFTTSNYKKYNEIITDKWDQLRWFLALHYKFNQRIDTPFWKTNRDKVNVSGYANLIELMKESGPLRQTKHMKNDEIRKQIENSIIKFSGLDTFLIGQGQLPLQRNEAFLKSKQRDFEAKTKIWEEVAEKSILHEKVLEILESNCQLFNPNTK
jgi:tryptophan halogenase